MTFDAKAHALNWKADADEDIDFAGECFERGKLKYGLFLSHLALEKLLKGLVCFVTAEEPPKIHNLIKLAELGDIKLTDDQKFLLGKINEFNITGRYNVPLAKLPLEEEAFAYYNQAKEIYAWLNLRY